MIPVALNLEEKSKKIPVEILNKIKNKKKNLKKI